MNIFTHVESIETMDQLREHLVAGGGEIAVTLPLDRVYGDGHEAGGDISGKMVAQPPETGTVFFSSNPDEEPPIRRAEISEHTVASGGITVATSRFRRRIAS